MRVDQGVARFEGDIVLDRARQLLAEAEAALGGGARVFDLAAVGHVDSSALSLLLALRRCAGRDGVRFDNVPDSLTALARLYGISDLL